MKTIAGSGTRRVAWVDALESRLLLFAENILVNSQNNAPLQLYSQSGSLLVTGNNYPSESSAGAGDGGSARALVVDQNDDVQLFTGTFDPFLQRSNGLLTASNTWTTEQTTTNTPGWSVVNRTFYGGLATIGNYVFATDMATGSGGGANGLIRFDASNNYAPTRFASGTDYCQVTLGLDGNIYGMVSPAGQPESGTVNVFNPNTLALIRSIPLSDSDDAAVVADAQGNIYTGAFDGTTRKISPAGVVLATAPIGSTDLQISLDGKILACAGDQILVLDENLNTLSSFNVASPYGAVFACWDTYQAVGSAPIVTSTSVTSSSASVTTGSPVTLTATVAPASYSGFETGTVQFFDGARTLGSPVTLDSATNSAGYTTSALAIDSHSITAVYSGDANFATSTSPPITVTVNPEPSAPSITMQPGGQSVVAGQVASFTAAASGSPTPAIQWEFSTDGGLGYFIIPGATSLTYSLSATLTENGYLYEAVFTNSQGSATTAPATLTVSAAPSIPAVTAEPIDQIIPEGQPVTFTADATGTPSPTVQWQISTDGGSSYTNIGGATSFSYGFTTSAGQNGELFRAVFANSQGSADSSAASLTLAPPLTAPMVSVQPSDQSALSGNPVIFVAAASGNPAPTIQWQMSTDGSSFTDVSGATSATLSFVAPFQLQPVFYRAVFTDSQGSAASDSATLRVMPSQLVVATPPPDSVGVGEPFSFAVDVVDGSNSVDASFNGSVTAAIATDASAALSGQSTVPVTDGVATFSGLAIDTPGPFMLAITSTDAAGTMTPALTITLPTSTAVPVFTRVSLPATGILGERLKSRIPVLITNSGPTLKGNFTINLYADSTDDSNGTQYLLTTVVKNVVLRTLKRTTLLAQIKTLPSSLPAGTYKITAELLDPIGAVNVATTTSSITLAAPFVNIRAAAGEVTPASILNKNSGSIVVILTNGGNVPTSGPITITLTPSSDDTTSMPPVLTSITSAAKIAPGKSRTYRLHFKPNGQMSAGDYYPFISVAYDGTTTTAVGVDPFNFQ